VSVLHARFPLLLSALWWGSVSAVGGVAVPALWAYLPSPIQAGGAVAAVLAAQTWISIACCVLLLVFSKRKHSEKQEDWAQGAMVFILGGLLSALVAQYGVAPRVVARQSELWNYAGMALLALQWCCALCTLWRVAGAQPHAGP
jgi:peptidoglycan biosynthesis protein MviN/MurJ (putative lipid II flippase)